ncbi:hypothetical protein [Cohnella nanjingensis]|uniref:hypothetical protein n=1 Tax=Cohnella nanjingensis TaxID=1387779 RepID=UPI001C88C8F8|nr:hypothetical protein [Cohnella nanjingensis]
MISLLVIYVGFFPSPTAELAVRKHLFFSFHPIKAFTEEVRAGSIRNDARYGDLYFVDSVALPAIYVRHNFLGYRVTSAGTGP